MFKKHYENKPDKQSFPLGKHYFIDEKYRLSRPLIFHLTSHRPLNKMNSVLSLACYNKGENPKVFKTKHEHPSNGFSFLISPLLATLQLLYSRES